MSIRPQFVQAILQGIKRFEFRRTRFRRKVDIVVIYATSPIGKVVGEFDVRAILAGPPEVLWRRTHDEAGIEEAAFEEYFRGASNGYAIEVGEVREYPNPYCPKERYGLRPPQSFAYLAPSA